MRQPKDERGRWTSWREWKARKISWAVLIVALAFVLIFVAVSFSSWQRDIRATYCSNHTMNDDGWVEFNCTWDGDVNLWPSELENQTGLTEPDQTPETEPEQPVEIDPERPSAKIASGEGEYHEFIQGTDQENVPLGDKCEFCRESGYDACSLNIDPVDYCIRFGDDRVVYRAEIIETVDGYTLKEAIS